MITTLPERCWILEFPNSDAWEEPHYDSEAEVRAVIAGRAEDDDPPDYYRARRLDRPCVIAACDGCRRTVGDDDGFDCVHFPDADMAAQWAREANFVLADGDGWCGDCRTKQHGHVPVPAAPEVCLRCSDVADEHPVGAS